jgi:hypothetical protein
VKFVASPATDWTDLAEPSTSQPRESEFAKSELKAMIERKRRNDFVRKREFDMLRKLRREGLNADQLAALGGSSRLDDSEAKGADSRTRPDVGVKAKIDEIEKQMVAENFGDPSRRHSDLFGAVTVPGAARSRLPRPFPPTRPVGSPAPPPLPASAAPSPLASSASPYGSPAPGAGIAGGIAGGIVARAPTGVPVSAASPPPGGVGPALDLDIPLDFTPNPQAQPAAVLKTAHEARSARPSPATEARGGSPAPSAQAPQAKAPAAAAPPAAAASAPKPAPAPAMRPVSFDGSTNFTNPFAVEVNEVMHDPELDEAVIAFANADFEHCEQSLVQVVAAKGPRHDHADTWLVLFDLYRAIGDQPRFEALALDYAQQFGWSAPQWVSLPQLVAESRPEEKTRSPHTDIGVGWTAPPLMDADAVTRLRALTLQLPMPWVFDWTALGRIDTQACLALSDLLSSWSAQALRMRWIGGDRLLAVLAEQAPVGARDADPIHWQLRLEALRMVNRPDQFDEVAIDYCVTYEVSPPSWEAAQCVVRIGESLNSTQQGSLGLSEMSTGFAESRLHDEQGPSPQVSVSLSGQLAGDIGAMLDKLTSELGAATQVDVSCERLIRVDFMAAGDIFNWVLQRRGEGRTISFSQLHRLLALFFGAMGINEHATVSVRVQ